MAHEIDAYFERMPRALPIYRALAVGILARFPETEIRVQKTQIAFYNRHCFACAWLPIRRAKGRPDCYLVLTVWLPRQLDSDRIAEISQPYPNRFAHHILLSDAAEADETLMDWVAEAYRFAQSKR